jgi:CBS domain-containing protein
MTDVKTLAVRTCMHEGVVTCAPEAGLDEVAAIMRERGISAVVVMEDGAALGLISKTDLVNAAFIEPYLRYWRGMAARHLMTSPVVSIGLDAPLGEALALLRSRRIHRLVVTVPGEAGERPAGILSLSDVVRVLSEPPSPDEEGP